MISNHQYFFAFSLILCTIFIASSYATFCSSLTSPDDKDTPCFLEPPSHASVFLRSSSNNLVLPCHIARSKRADIEWWYQDFQKTVNIKIYPVVPAVRPTAIRFTTSKTGPSKTVNESDIIDGSVLLRNVNVDDSGIYRCVIRPRMLRNLNDFDENSWDETSNLQAITYHVELTGPRLCQSNFGSLPCFSNMRTSSPTIVDAYQTAFLPCIVQNHNRPISVFWVIGNASENSVLITNYLSTNQHNNDRLRRVFPHSTFDYSIELIVNHDIHERTYSCVIDGVTDAETTLFTYIIRSMDFTDDSNKMKTAEGESKPTNKLSTPEHTSTITTPTTTATKIIAHDALTAEQIEHLREKSSPKLHEKHLGDDEEDNLLTLNKYVETSTSLQ